MKVVDLCADGAWNLDLFRIPVPSNIHTVILGLNIPYGLNGKDTII